MIGKCVSVSEKEVIIHFEIDSDCKAGKNYLVEPADTGTAAQNNAFHALLQEYWKSGLHSYDVKTFHKFRDYIKRDLGAGFDRYVYADIKDGVPFIKEADTWKEIPKDIRNANKKMNGIIRGRLKSWTDYSKKERCEAIDLLIAEMEQNGINSKKYQEIRAGMESLSKNKGKK